MPPPKTPILFATSIHFAKGVGDARAAQFNALGIRTCGDLLFHLPRDYLHFTDEAPVSAIRVGDVATIRGTILQTRMHRRPRARLEALLEDSSGTGEGGGGRCTLTWFNPFDLHKKILPGAHIRVTGKVTLFRNRPQITQPKVEYLDGKDEATLAPKTARLEPVYPASQDLPSPILWRIVKNILDPLIPQLDEWFPPAFLAERNFFTRQEAMRKIHEPLTLKESITARRTLAYHEFFLHQSAVAIKRYHQRNSTPAIPLRVDDAVDQRIRALLPFTLTAAQNRVIDTFRRDLAATKPMNRLLQGDVGSGKTVVALYAMLAATATPLSAPGSAGGSQTPEDADNQSVTATPRESSESKVLSSESASPKTQNSEPRTQNFSGHQAALMAPTEILAEQHFITLSRLLENKKVKIALLTGSVTGKERQATLAGLADGSIGIVVGTHALLSETVQFHSLALIVIDEQHKFGVEQRNQIRTKPSAGGGTLLTPHVLVMTATPIPRTLAMTAFGDLDVSVIDELPPGRQPIFTKLTPTANREDLYAWLATRLAQKDQAYIVVPAIDEDTPLEEELELAPDPEPAPSAPGSAGGTPSPEAAASDSELRTQNSELRPDPDYEPIKNQKSKIKNLANAISVQKELQSTLLANARVGLIHGRMPRDVRQHIMERFRQHLIDVLVATTVIEVGVDVPNAAIMIIENADRFGLSQLHQLRGRVGRGEKQSHCILLADLATDDSIARLQAMVRHSSGFHIAEQDLKLRGMGKMIGTAQSGRTDFHFADLLLDPILLTLSRRDAFNLIAADPRLLDPTHAKLRTAILNRFADSISLADVG